jgi:hypothetical protein
MSKVDEASLILDNGAYLNTGRTWGLHRSQRFIRHPVTSICFHDLEFIRDIQDGIDAIRSKYNRSDMNNSILIGNWAEQFLHFLREELLQRNSE